MCEIQNIHEPPQLPAAHFLSGYVLGEKKMFKTGSVETVSVNSGEQIMFNSFKGERFYYFCFFFFYLNLQLLHFLVTRGQQMKHCIHNVDILSSCHKINTYMESCLCPPSEHSLFSSVFGLHQLLRGISVSSAANCSTMLT